MTYQPGQHVLVFGKSMHAGQTGTVVRNDGQYVMLLADVQANIHTYCNLIDENYPNLPIRYFWVDRLCLKEIE